MIAMRTSQETPAAAATVQIPDPVVTITTVGPDGKSQTIAIPRSTGELRELLAQRQELSEQLTSVSSRRANLADQVRNNPSEATRAGLEDRLRLLDQRILQLETDLATTGRQIAMAPSELVEGAYNTGGGGGDFEEGLMIGGFSVMFLAAVAFLFVRRRWKRRAGAIPAQSGAESGERLARLENGMDAIAIEIERISEGQRFVTKLLSESQLAAGQPQRLPQPAGAESHGKR
jgi:hypothetical protein